MRRSALALAVVALLAGCFEIEHSIKFDQNMSGTADFHLGIDYEPLIVVMAQVGKQGPVPAADIARARAEFKKKSAANGHWARAEVEKGLPEGVTLIDFSTREAGVRITSDFKFGFKKLDHLINVELPQKEGADPTEQSVINRPFGNFLVINQDDRVSIWALPLNPAKEVEEGMAGQTLGGESEKVMRDAFRKVRVVYRINGPFPVMSHNATRKEGNTLIWEFDAARLEAAGKSTKLDDVALQVTYRR